MSYTDFLYKSIGKRVNYFRINDRTVTGLLHPSLDAYCEKLENIDPAVLSRIENGISLKKKNPYLISPGIMNQLSKLFDNDCKKLIWGTTSDKENFVKLLLIAILLNGAASINKESHNPFIYYENNCDLFRWAAETQRIPENLQYFCDLAINLYVQNLVSSDNMRLSRENEESIPIHELRTRLDTHFEEKYGFFYSKINFEDYALLNMSHDSSLVNLSDALFTQLMHNYEFVEGFTTRATTSIHNKGYDDDNILINAEQLLLHPSRFIVIALDFNGIYYFRFVEAFENAWKQNKDKYICYFTTKIFENPKLEESGLKHFQNSDFDEVIKSDSFYELCNTTSVMERYTSPEAILSYDFFRASIQKVCQENENRDFNGINSKLYMHLGDSVNRTKNLASKILKRKTTQ